MKTFGCKNEGCGCVVDIEGRMSFGQGELDRSNHWEFPCVKCARAKDKENEIKNIRQKECWPLPEREKTEIEIALDKFGLFLQNLPAGNFGGFLTIRPRLTGKPTKVFIWKTNNATAFYHSMESGEQLEEVTLA